MRSLTTGITNGRNFPPPLGISPCRKPLHALSVYSCCARVSLYFLPCRPKRLGSVHFVDQAEPFTSFDAVLQRRQHALIPHRSFHPRPVPAMCLCTLCSPLGHCRRSAFALLHCETHASTFLSPFPRHGFAFRASRGFRRFGTMETLTPAPLTTLSAGLPAYCATPSCRSVSNHVGLPEHRLPPRQRVQRVSDFAMNEQARRSTPAESSSFTYGPTIRLGLLPTPLRATQVPLASELWHTPARTFTVLMWRPHRRTHSRMLLAVVQRGSPQAKL